MKKYINIKKFMQNHVRNVQLAAVAVAGLGIATFCSAYSVPEGCTPSVTVDASVSSDIYPSCGTALVSAGCVGDDTSDTVTANNNGSGGANIPFNSDSGEACDTTSWGVADDPNLSICITLVNGLNKITAVSSELGITSSEVDIRSAGANSPTCEISVTDGCPCPGGVCGANVVFNFKCLNPTNTYTWTEWVVGNTTGLQGSPYPVSVDSDGNGSVPDRSSWYCPSEITPQLNGASSTVSQNWELDSNGSAVLSGSTTRVKTLAYAPNNGSTLTVTVSGDGSGTGSCTGTP